MGHRALVLSGQLHALVCPFPPSDLVMGVYGIFPAYYCGRSPTLWLGMKSVVGQDDELTSGGMVETRGQSK